MAVPIIPRMERGRLYFQTADVLFPPFKHAATAWSAAEAHRLDVAEPPLRHCENRRLDLTRDTVRAIGSCPRRGKDRAGLESCCQAFLAKDGAR